MKFLDKKESAVNIPFDILTLNCSSWEKESFLIYRYEYFELETSFRSSTNFNFYLFLNKTLNYIEFKSVNAKRFW